MTYSEIVVAIAFAVAFAAAVRHVVRHGLCSGCEKGGCGGNCAHCHGCCPSARAAGILASLRETPRGEDKP
jgi:hypothetical protein